jgi:hypothetical protein
MQTFKELINEDKETAKIIRTKLKSELGLSSRDVSVKSRNGGYSSAVNVSIKTLKALSVKQKIEELGQGNENYETDSASGEILSGGNTFIFTEIDWKFKDELGEKIQAEFEKVTKGEFNDDSKDVLLYKTFRIANLSGGGVYVSVKGNNGHSDVRDLAYVGSAVLQYISSSKDDSLYAKIK